MIVHEHSMTFISCFLWGCTVSKNCRICPKGTLLISPYIKCTEKIIFTGDLTIGLFAHTFSKNNYFVYQPNYLKYCYITESVKFSSPHVVWQTFLLSPTDLQSPWSIVPSVSDVKLTPQTCKHGVPYTSYRLPHA